MHRLVAIGVLKKINSSEWATPSFIIPKKDGRVRFISDFGRLNKQIKRKPYPLPHIKDMLNKLSIKGEDNLVDNAFIRIPIVHKSHRLAYTTLE